MESRLDSTRYEARNARNLLLLEREVFSWAGSEARETSGQGVKRGLEVLLVGFGPVYPPSALDSRVRGNDTRRAGIGACCPYRMWGQLPGQWACALRVSWASVASPVARNGVCRGAKPLWRGFGGVPRLLFDPPKIGGLRGLTGSLETASLSPRPVQRTARHDRILGSSPGPSDGFIS